MSFQNDSNSTSSTNLPILTHSALNIISMALLSTIIVVGVAGNLIVIYIFGIKTGSKRKRFETFLLILGIVDIVSSSVIPVSFLYLTITNYQQWHFGVIGCKIIPSLLQISITVSQGVLILICYERYQAIVHPFKKRLPLPHVTIWLVFIFALAIALSIPYALTLEIVNDSYYQVNTCNPGTDKGTTLLVSACINLLKDLLASYLLICLSHRMRLSLTKKYNNITWSRAQFSQKGRRTLVFVIIIFLLLTLPVDTFRVVAASLFLTGYEITQGTYNTLVVCNTLLNILQMCNSVVNVFIYSKVHSNFLATLSSCLKKRKEAIPTSPSSGGIGNEVSLLISITSSDLIYYVEDTDTSDV